MRALVAATSDFIGVPSFQVVLSSLLCTLVVQHNSSLVVHNEKARLRQSLWSMFRD